MSDNIRLINDDTETVISNLSNYYEEITNSMSDMSKVIGSLTSCLEGEVADSITKKFSEYEEQFPFINECIQSYVEYFKNLVTKFDDQDTKIKTDEVTKSEKGGDIINVNN